MKVFKLLVVSMLIVFCQNVFAAPDLDNEITIAAVVKEIQDGIDIANNALAKDRLPSLSSVKLDLNTVIKKEVGPNFKFLIFSFGKKWTNEASQLTTITLIPSVVRVIPTAEENISNKLAQMIIAAANGVNAASTHVTVPLSLDALSIQQKFIVKNETSGAISIKLLSAEKSEVQTMTLIFKNK